MTSPTFAALGLAEPLLNALVAQTFTTPTPIQAASIPGLLEGRDLLGIAQTGTGKTAAFALPLLQHLMGGNIRPAPFAPRALVLAPTRELALQIEDTFRKLGAQTRLRTAIVIGGASRFKQVEAMRRGADIVIGTPGRICDLMNTRELRLESAHRFVLDEADRMLDLGFIKDIRKFVGALPVQRQSSLFSATMPPEVAKLAAGLLQNPMRVEIARVEATTPKIVQSVHFVPQAAKRALLADMLGDPDFSRVIVFTRTKRGANRVAEDLEAAGHRVNALHGNKSQAQREKALDQFKSGRARVLVATDIAARGIDVNGISHVINYDLPAEPESYVHRIGRTARAGAAGIAISFCDNTEVSTLRAIERQIGNAIPVAGGSPPPAGSQGRQPQRPSSPGQAARRRRPQGNNAAGRVNRAA
ncbi:MAG: DEAD/DEAH box helicase [Acetobacteraceae bacterium]|nr:DEAD/DEAH box helicase [Acetobacteraceae bacterium]